MSGAGAARKITLGATLLVILGIAADAAGLLNFMGVPNLPVYPYFSNKIHHSAGPSDPAPASPHTAHSSAAPKKSSNAPKPKQSTSGNGDGGRSDRPVDGAPKTLAPPTVRYLADLTPVQDSGNTMEFGSAQILKQEYRHSVSLCVDGVFGANQCANNGNPTWAEYSVPSGYERLAGTIGLSADAPSDCHLSVQILGDGNYLFDRDLELNEQFPVKYSVGSINRVRLQMHALDGHGRCDLVFGDMRLSRS